MIKDLKKILVIIPTYNEKENIKLLIEKVLEQSNRIDILVVDDNSPDGTGDIVEEIQRFNSRVFLKRRQGKLGLGTAYKAGFEYAIENNYDAVITMDADFSHHPRYLPNMIKALSIEEMSVGSRYVKGGGVKNWPLRRIILSYCANKFAKFMLGLKSNDNTAGFKGYRIQALKKLNYKSITSDGYSFLVEISYRARLNNIIIREVPIIFEDRKKGESKISKEEIFKAIKMLFILRFTKN